MNQDLVYMSQDYGSLYVHQSKTSPLFLLF